MNIYLDHRIHPRKKSNEVVLLKMTQKEGHYKMIDFSYDGISFISNDIQEEEQLIELIIDQETKINILVINCVLHWIEEKELRAAYKVCCRYLEQIDPLLWDKIQKNFSPC